VRWELCEPLVDEPVDEPVEETPSEECLEADCNDYRGV